MSGRAVIEDGEFGYRLRLAASFMGVQIHAAPDDFEDPDYAHVQWGPQLHVGLSIQSRSIYAPADALAIGKPLDGALGVLHELGHLVFWGPQSGLDVPEHWFLPWEAAVFGWVNRGDDRLYWSESYTQLTTVDPPGVADARVIASWRSPKRSGWYRSALSLCQRLGVLNRNVVPTWQAPDWSRRPDYFPRP